MNLEDVPTAVQGRIFGSKGMWALDPENQCDLPQIQIRNSQQKIKLVHDMFSAEFDTLHRAHFIFDLVSTARVTAPAHLSRHTIINLNHNGVPVDVFEELLQKSIERELAPLRYLGDSPHAMQLLVGGIERVSNVALQRVQMYAGGAQRAYGLASRWDDERTGDNVEGADEGTSSVPGTSSRLPGGKPMSAAESALLALRAGFTLDDEIVFGFVKQVQKDILKSVCEKLRLLLPCSGEAPMICGMSNFT